MQVTDDELIARARLRVGSVLSGKYRIERVLGVGGMAAVYEAVHRNGRRVALKLLHPELSTRPEVRTRFLREGHAANAVNHAGAVVVIDDDVAEDGAAFLVMELLQGQSLEELWEQSGQRLPAKMVLAVARELCDVLAAAHRAGIVHRDIKPANVFVTTDDRVKVLDFGIAHVRDAAAPKMTQTGTIVGTPAFMAPEQASGRTSQVDAQTDIWAVGATMFTLLSGAVVHEGETQQHVVILAATQSARSLAAVATDVPAAVVAIVDRALAFEKHARWPTMDVMLAAVRDAALTLEEQHATATPPISETLPAQRIVVEPGQHSMPLMPPSGDRPKATIVGSTTEDPVSSDTTTPEQTAVTRFRTRRFAPILTTVAASVGFVGRSMIPASRWASRLSRRAGGLPEASALRIGLVALGSSLVGLSIVLAVALSGRKEAAPNGVQSASQVAPAVSPRTDSDLPLDPRPPSVMTTPAVFGVTSSTAAEPVSSATPSSLPVERLPKASSVKNRGPSSAPAPKLNCTPAFIIRDGIAIHKPGCP